MVVTADQGNGVSEHVRQHIGDLIKTMTDQNADRALVGHCLEHLHMVLETLGERPAAKSLLEQLEDGDGTDIDLSAWSKKEKKK